MAAETRNVTFDKHRRQFTDFIEFDEGQGTYMSNIRQMMQEGNRRILLNLSDVRNFNPEMADSLMAAPAERLPAYEAALKDVVINEDPNFRTPGPTEDAEFHVGLDGAFGANHVSPRTLVSALLSQLVCIDGIVTKASLVRPKVVKSVHYCPATKSSINREYRDATSLTGMPTGSTYPTKDDQGNLLETEFGLSVYRDVQKLTIQEMPERAPPGQLPCSIDVQLEDDLVDLCKPGDRVQIVGVYRAIPAKAGGSTQGIFKTVVVANYLRQLSKEITQPQMTDVDIENIKQLAKSKHAFKTLSESLAPYIYCHTQIKQGLLLQLLGGVEKNLKNGAHIRGDINMMCVGDPSTAKSQLLRSVMNIAPLAISTTGRGSSGVGLTAAVTADESGERRLEAGAMVLADRGIVCIDEFDKMSDADRVAIHEVMEQQTVTIAKAGIHASLNARCSILAAANPIYGSYDRSLPPVKNIGLPDSLLSRFDLLFIVLDEKDPQRDATIADHVLRMHRYCPRGQEGQPIVFSDKFEEMTRYDEDEGPPMYQPKDRLLHGHFTSNEILSIPFLKKYIHYAKTRNAPKITDEASERIVMHYGELRSKDAGSFNTLPVTARTLETLIRLSSAVAKCRLAREILESDVDQAFGIMEAAIFSERKFDTDVAQSDDEEPGESGADNEDDNDDDDDEAPKGPPTARQASKRARASGDGAQTEASQADGEEEGASVPDDSGAEAGSDRKRAKAGEDGAEKPKKKAAVSGATRKAQLSELMRQQFMAANADCKTMDEIMDQVNSDKSAPADKYTSSEVRVVAEELEEDNKVMVDGDTVYPIV